MKIGLLSDIHSRDAALEWALGQLADVEAVFNLGDTVGYKGDVNRCFELLNARGVVNLAGNHDLEALEEDDPDSDIAFFDGDGNFMAPDFGLQDEYKSQIREMRREIREVIDRQPFFFAHEFCVDPKKSHSVTITSRNVQELLAHAGNRCCFLGGNHQWELFVVAPRGGGVEHEEITESRRIAMEPDKAYVLYVGSTAIPSYCIVDTENESIDIVIETSGGGQSGLWPPPCAR